MHYVSVMQKGVPNGVCFPPISLYETDIPQRHIFTDHVTWCILSVLEFIALSWNGGGGGKEGGWVGWGVLISNFNLQFTAESWKNGYSCYILFFTNFVLIYWTCLMRFGGKFHSSCNLAHTVRDLD